MLNLTDHDVNSVNTARQPAANTAGQSAVNAANTAEQRTVNAANTAVNPESTAANTAESTAEPAESTAELDVNAVNAATSAEPTQKGGFSLLGLSADKDFSEIDLKELEHMGKMLTLDKFIIEVNETLGVLMNWDLTARYFNDEYVLIPSCILFENFQ